MSASSVFDWFTGLATISQPCPPALRANNLGVFFSAPNRPEFGVAVPRVLMHECLHAFQLAGSRWLQRMVAEEWRRLLEFERTGRAPALGRLRSAWGRPPAGYPFSVRDLVECLARFWDVHIRGARRILAEDAAVTGTGQPIANGPEGEVGFPLADRAEEYEAAIRTGQKLDSYPVPYLHLQWAAAHAPAVLALGPSDANRLRLRASWAAQLLLPMAGFVALNTDEPVQAYVIAVDSILADPDTGALLKRGNEWDLIELDWLTHWGWIVERMSAALTRSGLPPKADPAGLRGEPGWTEHPVWRYHAERFQALAAGLVHLMSDEGAGRATEARPWRPVQHQMLCDLLRKGHSFAAYALMGIPDLRSHLGSAFAPPLLRFADADCAATSSASPRAPWPVDAVALTAAVEACVARHRALRSADVAAKFNAPSSAFRPQA